MEYREHLPWPSLRPFVRGLWSLSSAGPGSSRSEDRSQVEHIVPDGCPEIIVNRAAPYGRLLPDGTLRLQPRVLLVGQFRSAIAITPTGEVDLIGIRFEPGGLHAVLGVAMHELTDQDLRLGDLDLRLHDALASAARATPPSAPVEALQGVLAGRVERRGLRGAGLVGAALEQVGRGADTTERIARSLGVTRRGLERLFRREVGLSPKRYVRIQRLQAVLRRLETGRPREGWAGLAHGCGYADQSHLIRDFRLLAGTTPGRYLAERTSLARFFELGELSRPSNS